MGSVLRLDGGKQKAKEKSKLKYDKGLGHRWASGQGHATHAFGQSHEAKG